MDAYPPAVVYAPPMTEAPPAGPGLPGPYLARVRAGLGIAVLCSTVSALAGIIRLAIEHGDFNLLMQRDITGTLLGLCCIVGWWIFATPSPATEHRPAHDGVAWMVRLSLLIVAGALIYNLFTMPAAATHPPTQMPPPTWGTIAWGLLTSAAGLMQFYGVLVLVRRLGAAIGDAWMQRHAVVCMIAMPVLVLIAIAGMAIYIAFTTIGLLQSTVNPSTPSTAEGLPPDVVMVGMLGLMAVVMVWYLGFLMRVWVKLGRVGVRNGRP